MLSIPYSIITYLNNWQHYYNKSQRVTRMDRSFTRQKPPLSAADNLCAGFLVRALVGYDLQPVPVGIVDEVDAHGWILVADASHLLVPAVRTCVVIDAQGEMELVVPEVVGL